MKNVQIAMLGAGFVADFYMQGLANVNGQQVVANYSRDDSRALAFAERWAVPQASTDLDQLIGRDDIDLFVIALPNEGHLPVSLALSKAKRNQVCTKPLGRNQQEAMAMLEAAKASAALHASPNTQRFPPCIVNSRHHFHQA